MEKQIAETNTLPTLQSVMGPTEERISKSVADIVDLKAKLAASLKERER